MEYIYGITQRNGVIVENLKTIGDQHSNLSGFIQTIRKYDDSAITDSCNIIEHYQSNEDSQGKCYDWYIITDHWRNIDTFTPIKKSIEETNAAAAITFVSLAENGTIDAVTAGEHTNLFADWQINVNYQIGNIRKYNNNLYRCLQAHTSQDDWNPEVSTSLWVNMADPAEEWPAWSQPVGATDAYMNGDKVSYNEKYWVSIVDNNVWEPGVYGWEEQEV